MHREGREPLQTKQGNRHSCRDQEGRRGSEEVVPGPSVFPLREPGLSGNFWVSREGCQVLFRTSGWNMGLPLRPRSGQRPHLSIWGNHVVFLELRRDSRVMTGISGFLLGWPWEAQSSPGVARESWGLHSSHCRAKETSSSRVSGTSYSSQGKTGISGLHSRLPRGVRPRLEGKQRTPLSSRVMTRISWSPLAGSRHIAY